MKLNTLFWGYGLLFVIIFSGCATTNDANREADDVYNPTSAYPKKSYSYKTTTEESNQSRYDQLEYQKSTGIGDTTNGDYYDQDTYGNYQGQGASNYHINNCWGCLGNTGWNSGFWGSPGYFGLGFGFGNGWGFGGGWGYGGFGNGWGGYGGFGGGWGYGGWGYGGWGYGYPNYWGFNNWGFNNWGWGYGSPYMWGYHNGYWDGYYYSGNSVWNSQQNQPAKIYGHRGSVMGNQTNSGTVGGGRSNGLGGGNRPSVGTTDGTNRSSRSLGNSDNRQASEGKTPRGSRTNTYSTQPRSSDYTRTQPVNAYSGDETRSTGKYTGRTQADYNRAAASPQDYRNSTGITGLENNTRVPSNSTRTPNNYGNSRATSPAPQYSPNRGSTQNQINRQPSAPSNRDNFHGNTRAYDGGSNSSPSRNFGNTSPGGSGAIGGGGSWGGGGGGGSRGGGGGGGNGGSSGPRGR